METEALARSREMLFGAGYTATDLARLLRTGSTLNLTAAELPRPRLLLDVTRPLDCLTALLLLGDELDETTAERSLGDGLGVLAAAGLIRRQAGIVRPLVQVVPHDDLLISSDRPPAEQDPHFVPGVQGPSDLLARLTPRTHVERALDIGTGCGVQALLLAHHADRVVATDISERAIDIARRNAGLNEATTIEFRRGDMLEPVSGEQFDLIVANPPYPISPEHTYVFRDAPVRGDELSRHLLENLPVALRPGGIAIMLVSWVDTDGPPEALSWAANRGLDVLLLVTQVRSAIDDGLAWNQDQLPDPEEHQIRVRRRWSFFEAEGIDALGYGALVIRRRADEMGFSAAVPFPFGTGGTAGHQVVRLLAAHEALANASGDVTRTGALVLAPDAQLTDRRQRDARGAWVTAHEVRLSGGVGIVADLDHEGAAILSAFERPATAVEAIDRAARELGRAASDLRTDAERIVERALTTGFLELAG